jgi:hypothetical protein
MITVTAGIVWLLLGGLSAFPAISGPAALLYFVLGSFVSLRIERRLGRAEMPIGCVAAGCLFEYTVFGFAACVGGVGTGAAVWLWVAWGIGVVISQTLVSGARFPTAWLPFHQQWARLGLAWLSLGLLTAPLLVSLAPYVLDRIESSPDLLGLSGFLLPPLVVLAWTAWVPVVVWRLLVSEAS